MEFMTDLFYFARPILSIATEVKVVGMDVFDALVLGLMMAFVLTWLTRLLSGRGPTLTVVDGLIIGYAAWIGILVAAFPEQSIVGEAAKFAIPLLSFVFFKSVLESRAQFRRSLFFLLLGFLVPTLMSAWMIAHGEGLNRVLYWTGLERYQGVFVNPHNLGHMMALNIMVAVCFIWFKYVDREPDRRGWLSGFEKVVLILSITAAFYGLYESYVRTALLGLVVFLATFLYLTNKKILVLAVLAGAVAVIVALPVVMLIFSDVIAVSEGKQKADQIASGRPYIWSHNLAIFDKLPLERKLMGVGVGNRVEGIMSKEIRFGGSESGFEIRGVWNSHNDFLEAMMQTGLVGLVMFLGINLGLLVSIMKLPERDRGFFLALFLAVAFMNFSSNSYLSRFSVGQIYWMIMAYVQSKAARSKS